MTLGADYPLLEAIWTILMIFLFVMWVFLVLRIIIDVFRRDDMSGLRKAAWTATLIFIPIVGVLFYLIIHGGNMAGREIQQVRAQQAQVDDYVRSVAGSGGAAAEIEQAKRLLDNGSISQDEFDKLKAKALAS